MITNVLQDGSEDAVRQAFYKAQEMEYTMRAMHDYCHKHYGAVAVSSPNGTYAVMDASEKAYGEYLLDDIRTYAEALEWIFAKREYKDAW